MTLNNIAFFAVAFVLVILVGENSLAAEPIAISDAQMDSIYGGFTNCLCQPSELHGCEASTWLACAEEYYPNPGAWLCAATGATCAITSCQQTKHICVFELGQSCMYLIVPCPGSYKVWTCELTFDENDEADGCDCKEPPCSNSCLGTFENCT